MRSAWNSSVDAPSGSRLLSTELWSFPPAPWIICLPGHKNWLLILSPSCRYIVLLLSCRLVTAVLTAPFSCLLPETGLPGCVLAHSDDSEPNRQLFSWNQPAESVRSQRFPHPRLAFLPRLALSIYQNTLQAPVSAPPQPARVARFAYWHSVCCGALTLGIAQTGHSCVKCVCVWSVCVCVCVCVSPQGWFWVYSDSPAGWAMATTGGPRRPRRRDTPHTLSILPDRCAYLKEDSLSPSLLRSIIFHWATEQTWQSWQAIAVGWACNSSPALPLTHTHTHTHTGWFAGMVSAV